MVKIVCNRCGDYIEATKAADAVAWDQVHQANHDKEDASG